ncbi:hypothetical protein V2I01_17145 [Micromonospora sp. BRA006-A]|nr:hypothetical protein [Micromonospora sp. BRA006-A]
MTGIRQGLDMMSSELRAAQSKAESPEKTDDNDKLLSGAGKGFLIGGAPGAVIGGIVGHQQDKAEQEKAHQRMVQVVAKLSPRATTSRRTAASSCRTRRRPRCPATPATATPTLQNGPSVKTPSSGPSLGSFGPGANATATTSGVHHTAPTGGTPGEGTPGAGTGRPARRPGSGFGADQRHHRPGRHLAGRCRSADQHRRRSDDRRRPGPVRRRRPDDDERRRTGWRALRRPGVLSTGSLAGTGTNAASSARFGGMSGAENRSAAGTGRLTSGRGLVVDAGSKSAERTGGATGRPAMAGRSGVLGGRGTATARVRRPADLAHRGRDGLERRRRRPAAGARRQLSPAHETARHPGKGAAPLRPACVSVRPHRPVGWLT